MSFVKTGFPGLFLINPNIFEDRRGYFYESYNQKTFQEAGIDYQFIQDNQAQSIYGVVRGLHFQSPPYAQTKLIRAIEGAILDVAVDIRKGSPTYGKVFTVELSSENRKQLLVPKGFAHGYSVISPTAEVLYKCDAFYHKSSEAGILCNDEALEINWRVPTEKMVLSEKDKAYPSLVEINTPFIFME